MSFRPRNPIDKPSNPEDIAQRRYHATRCAWTTNGRQCLLTGTSSPDTSGATAADGTVTPPRCFCPFHAEAISHGHGGNDSRDFGDWLEAHVTNYPTATDYTSNGMDALWQAAIGNARLPAQRKAEAEGVHRPATREQRTTALAKAKALLDGRFS